MVKEVLMNSEFSNRFMTRDGHMAIMWNYFESESAEFTFELILNSRRNPTTVVDVEGKNIDGIKELDLVARWE